MSEPNLSHPETASAACPLLPADELPAEEELWLLADTYKIFGDSTRLKIIFALMQGELCVQEISAALAMSQSAVSHQLRILRASRLVKSRRDGRNILYSIDDGHVVSILLQGLNHVRRNDCYE